MTLVPPRPTGKPVPLFLQGPPSPFAREWGAALAARGAEVHRINLSLGDWLWWRGPGVVNYRGSARGWRGFLDAYVAEHGITEILYFADRLPAHRVAQEVARKHGIGAWSYEYGYLRPDWVLFEPTGQSTYSHLTTDLARIRKAARGLPPAPSGVRYPWPALPEDFGDVTWNLANYFGALAYPGYRRDRLYNPVVEYLSYLPRHVRARAARGPARALVERLVRATTPYYVVPLQMQNDYQLRRNAAVTDQRALVVELIASFAAHAPQGAELVFKLHPNDNGLVNWERLVLQQAALFGLAGRIHVLDGGDLERLFSRAAGVITTNSTAGIAALRARVPVKVMGIAVYDIAGLTCQDPLDGFWTTPFRPAKEDVDAFVAVLAAHVNLRGNFYTPEGRAAAILGLVDRLIGDPEALFDPEVFDPVPPRLARARAEGVPMDD